jgi:hypothetical protein
MSVKAEVRVQAKGLYEADRKRVRALDLNEAKVKLARILGDKDSARLYVRCLEPPACFVYVGDFDVKGP